MTCLKAIRKRAKISQKRVAEAVSIAQSTYSNIESGKRRPSPEVAQKIAEVLGFDWTLFYTDQPQKPEGNI